MSMPQSGPQGPADPGQPGSSDAATTAEAQVPAGPPQGGPAAGQPGQPGLPGQPGQPGGQWRPEWGPGPQQGAPVAAVDDPTRVVGRRVVQFIIDIILVAIVPAILWVLLVRDHGARLTIGILVWVVLAIAIHFWYWVMRPNRHRGQTFGMQMLGLAVVSKRGGPASMGQLAGRWILLIVDDFFYGVVGLITMLVSRQHQRVGDHAAGTLVVRADSVSAR